jgi:hypothetical protein
MLGFIALLKLLECVGSIVKRLEGEKKSAKRENEQN